LHEFGLFSIAGIRIEWSGLERRPGTVFSFLTVPLSTQVFVGVGTSLYNILMPLRVPEAISVSCRKPEPNVLPIWPIDSLGAKENHFSGKKWAL